MSRLGDVLPDQMNVWCDKCNGFAKHDKADKDDSAEDFADGIVFTNDYACSKCGMVRKCSEEYYRK